MAKTIKLVPEGELGLLLFCIGWVIACRTHLYVRFYIRKPLNRPRRFLPLVSQLLQDLVSLQRATVVGTWANIAHFWIGNHPTSLFSFSKRPLWVCLKGKLVCWISSILARPRYIVRLAVLPFIPVFVFKDCPGWC